MGIRATAWTQLCRRQPLLQRSQPARLRARRRQRTTRARILILEDEAWDAERAQSLGTSAGLDFTCVVVATKALFMEKLDSFRPDVILSDYHLPGFSGAAALAIAQER